MTTFQEIGISEPIKRAITDNAKNPKIKVQEKLRRNSKGNREFGRKGGNGKHKTTSMTSRKKKA